MSISQYTIYELLDLTDDRYWKLHWFEQLTFNQKTREPLIEALFVPLIRTDLDIDANPPELLENKSYDFSQSKKIEVGGGQLPMLHIGLLLHQGRPTKRPHYQRKVFNLYIGEDTTKVHPILEGHKPDQSKWKVYDIPYKEYHLSGTNNYVRCLHIEVPLGRRDKITKIIIPCAEVIRFHYGNSTELFREILTDGLAGSPNRVFDPSKTVLPGNNEGRIPFIQLSPYVKRQDAPVVARFAFDPYARKNGMRIFKSAQINSTRPCWGRDREKHGYVPEVYLPYVNKQTRLVVHGKKIISGTRRYFLVYYIESDSAPFPFQHFEYGQDGSDDIRVVTDQGLPDAGRSVRAEKEVLTVSDEVEELIIRTDKEPSPTKKQVEELLWEDKFPDLNKKKWVKRDSGNSRKQPPRSKPRFVQGHGDTKEGSTAFRGSSENKVSPLTVIHDFDSNEEILETVIEKDAVPDTEEVPMDGMTGEVKPNEVKPRRTTDYNDALPASRKLFKELVNMLHEVLPEKIRCEFVKVPKSGEEKTLGRPLLSSFPTEWKGTDLPWSTVTHKGETRARYVAAARGVCHEEHYFYLLEIDPPEHDEEKERKAHRKSRKTSKPRRYTLLLIYDDRRNFADMSSEDLRKVLAFCAMNDGSWLKKLQLKQFGRYKFKHASKGEIVFVSRIIEQLWKASLVRLTKREETKWVREPKRLKTYKLPKASESSQDVEPSRTDESASRVILSSQPPEVDQASQTDQATTVAISSEAGESSESNERSEINESSDGAPSD